MHKLVILFVCSLAVHYLLILVLRKLKGFQQINKHTPETHLAKSRIPSFGGIGMLICVILGLWLYRGITDELVWCVSLYCTFAAIGFIDDLFAVTKKDNEGLTPLFKLVIQIVISYGFLLVYSLLITPLSLVDFFVYCFVIVGASNATNLSDGLDGLLSGLAIISFLGFWLYFEKLDLGSMQIIAQVFLVVLAAFLVFNFKPAKIFMGDTGSLSIGALLGGFCVILDSVWALVFLGAVYILETLCVIAQVLYFRLRGKRLFLMAPLHHHFELLGFSEVKTVLLFWAIGVLFFMVFLVDKVMG